jgi:hypothetical protein
VKPLAEDLEPMILLLSKAAEVERLKIPKEALWEGCFPMEQLHLLGQFAPRNLLLQYPLHQQQAPLGVHPWTAVFSHEIRFLKETYPSF